MRIWPELVQVCVFGEIVLTSGDRFVLILGRIPRQETQSSDGRESARFRDSYLALSENQTFDQCCSINRCDRLICEREIPIAESTQAGALGGRQ
jgi:hypothetical protein